MPLKSLRALLAIFIAITLLSLMIACSKGDEEDEDEKTPAEAETTGAKYKPTGNEGSVIGTVALNGTAPGQKPISMDADAACAQNNPNPVTEDVVVKDGKLQNVFIYIKDGKTTDGKSFATLAFDVPTTSQTLDQKGCHYIPHVLGIQTKQKLTITNSDPTTHNVHPSPKSNPEWNQSQSSGQAPIEKTFDRAEVVIPVKCNQHPWMKSYIGVLKHPFYAVSGSDGKFEIKGLPPGTYTLAAWHEKYGEKTQSITVGAKESKTQDFSFDAGASASLQPGSLKVMPALEVPMLMKH